MEGMVPLTVVFIVFLTILDGSISAPSQLNSITLHKRVERQLFPNSMTTQRAPLNVITYTMENSLDPQIRACMNRLCPSTNQYNPVCGDDNITYTNRRKLTCAQSCNYQVREVYAGSCLTTPAPNRK